VLLADDVLLTNSDDDLQYSVQNLNDIDEELFVEINTGKTKIIAFRGNEPVRNKIRINNGILEQVNSLNYFGCNMSFEGETDLNMKITSFIKVMGIINQIFKPSLVFRHTIMQIYKTLASRPTLTVLWK
jgi:hypothetical protein